MKRRVGCIVRSFVRSFLARLPIEIQTLSRNSRILRALGPADLPDLIGEDEKGHTFGKIFLQFFNRSINQLISFQIVHCTISNTFGIPRVEF